MSNIKIDGTTYREEDVTFNWGVEYVKALIKAHADEGVLDHTDGSVTLAKLATDVTDLIGTAIKGAENANTNLADTKKDIAKLETDCKNHRLVYKVYQLKAGETFSVKPGMIGLFATYGDSQANAITNPNLHYGLTMGSYKANGNTIESNMGTGLFFSEEVGEGLNHDTECPIEYPFGKSAKCSTVSGAVTGLDVRDDVLRLEGGSNGGYLGDLSWGSRNKTGVTVKFDLFMSEYEQFRLCPTAFDTFPDDVRYGLDITSKGEICKLEVSKDADGNSVWTSVSLDEPLFLPLNEWHTFVLSYDNLSGNIAVYMDDKQIFSYTEINMSLGAPADFSLVGGDQSKTYMNNIEMYFAPFDTISEDNLKCSYMKQTMYWEHRIIFVYSTGVSAGSHHDRFAEGVYLKNNGAGNAYVFYIEKGQGV